MTPVTFYNFGGEESFSTNVDYASWPNAKIERILKLPNTKFTVSYDKKLFVNGKISWEPISLRIHLNDETQPLFELIQKQVQSQYESFDGLCVFDMEINLNGTTVKLERAVIASYDLECDDVTSKGLTTTLKILPSHVSYKEIPNVLA